MITYGQQKIMMLLKEKRNITRRQQNIYDSIAFYSSVKPLINAGLIKVKKNIKNHTNTYRITFDGDVFVNYLRVIK